MITRQYNAKETAILEGVVRLINQGADLRSLTAEDMARSAGIGKGTLYLYFSSKEDILAHAMGYCIQNQLRELSAAAGRAGCFREKCLSVLGCLRSSASRGNTVFQLMISGLLGEDFFRFYDGEFRRELDGLLDDILDSLARAGIEEGVLTPPREPEYLRQALLSAALGFCYRYLCPPCRDEDAMSRGMEYAVRIAAAAGAGPGPQSAFSAREGGISHGSL